MNEREELIKFWESLGKPVFVLTGDVHNSFSVKITDRIWELASGPHNSRNHRADAEGNPPPNGTFDSAGRKCEIRWSSYFLPDVPAELVRQPIYTVVQVNNVFDNRLEAKTPRWVAYPHPQVDRAVLRRVHGRPALRGVDSGGSVGPDSGPQPAHSMLHGEHAMPRRRLLTFAVLLLAMAMSGLSDAQPAPGTLFLHAERIPLAAGGFATAERGTFYVPVNRANPAGGVLALEVYRFKAATAATKGTPPIFRLYGGPNFLGLAENLATPGFFEQDILPYTRDRGSRGRQPAGHRSLQAHHAVRAPAGASSERAGQPGGRRRGLPPDGRRVQGVLGRPGARSAGVHRPRGRRRRQRRPAGDGLRQDHPVGRKLRLPLGDGHHALLPRDRGAGHSEGHGRPGSHLRHAQRGAGLAVADGGRSGPGPGAERDDPGGRPSPGVQDRHRSRREGHPSR